MVKRDSKTRIKPKGLRNKGNDCFFNSSMQCILSLVDITTFYSCTSFSPQQKVSRDLQNFIALFNGPDDIVVPEEFIQSLREKISLLNGRQQDSQELILVLINILFKELEANSKEVYEDMGELEDLKKRNIIASTFFGMSQTSVVCSTCLKRFKCMHHFSMLPLNIFSNIKESLKFFEKEEDLENENKWKCSACNSSKSSKHKVEIIDCPKVLIVHLLRFDGGYRKDNRGVDVDEEISMGGKLYEVVGLVCHTGVLNSGHYISYAKRSGGWYCFDDSVVSKVSDVPFKNSNGYLIFYQRK